MICYNNAYALQNTIETFNPLIKKYSRLLQYNEAESDLTTALIIILCKMPRLQNQALIVGYVAKSLKNEYIALSKKRQRQANHELLRDEVLVSEDGDLDIELTVDVKNALSKLTENQKYIIYLKYYLDYSDAEIASILNISRQAVNKLKRAALQKLKALLERGMQYGG